MHVVVNVNNNQVDVIVALLRVNDYVVLLFAVCVYIFSNLDVECANANLIVGVNVQDRGLASLDLVLRAQVSRTIQESDGAGALIVRSDLGQCIVLAVRVGGLLVVQTSQVNSAIGVVGVLESGTLGDTGVGILRLESNFLGAVPSLDEGVLGTIDSLLVRIVQSVSIVAVRSARQLGVHSNNSYLCVCVAGSQLAQSLNRLQSGLAPVSNVLTGNYLVVIGLVLNEYNSIALEEQLAISVIFLASQSYITLDVAVNILRSSGSIDIVTIASGAGNLLQSVLALGYL